MESSDPDGNQILFQLLFLLFLTLVNAFFAGAEMAVVSVNKNKIRQLAGEGDKRAALIQTLFEDSTKFLSTIQVAITFAGFFSSASAATGISQVLGTWLQSFSIPYSHTLAVVIVTIILSYFTLVFGELVPKRIALQKAEQFSLLVVKPINMISKVMSPFIRLLSMSTNGFLRLIGMKTGSVEDEVTEEEIKAMLQTGSETGVFNDIEKDMINSIFSFNDKEASEIMVPRREVVAIDISEPISDNIDEILESRHTRIPVYENQIDNIIGILHIKEYLLEMRKAKSAGLDIRSMLHKPYFVMSNKNIDELFIDMQHTRTRLAVLIDEYGGFSGIVTIEDLVEEIMGELNDEHEEQIEMIQQTGEHEYLLEGSMTIDDLNQELKLKLSNEDYDTLSGLLIGELDFIPEDENLPPIIIDDNEFKILKVEDKRIRKVSLRTKIEPAE